MLSPTRRGKPSSISLRSDDLTAPKRITDGPAETSGIVCAEVKIVVDQIYAGLRANEPSTTTRVEPNAGTKITIQVIEGMETTHRLVNPAIVANVVAGAERSHAADQFQVGVARKFVIEHGIAVPKKRAIVETLLVVILPLRRPPENLATKGNVVENSHIAANAYVGAAGEGHRLVIFAVGVADTWGLSSAEACGEIKSLRVRESRKDGNERAGKGQKQASP